MNLTVSQIVSKIRINLDEIGLNDSDFIGVDTSNDNGDESDLETIIKDKIMDAMRFCYSNADPALFDYSELTKSTAVTALENPTFVSGRYVYSWTVPDAFLRVVYAKLSTWKRSIWSNDIELDTDPDYTKMWDKNVIGTDARPKAFFIDSNHYLYLFSSKKSDATGEVAYLQMPEANDDGSYTISNKLYDACLYYITGLVLMVLEDAHASDFFTLAVKLLGLGSSISVQQSSNTQES